MTYEALRQEVIGLPDDKMRQLIEFARFLKTGSGASDTHVSPASLASFTEDTGGAKEEQGSATAATEVVDTIVRGEGAPKRKFGCMAESITFIASDFDSCFDDEATLAGLEDYV